MRSSGEKKSAAVLIVLLASLSASLFTSGVAWGHPVHPHHAVLRFNAAAQEIQLTIPTPQCPPNENTCEWMLFVNEPDVPGHPVLASVIGTVGTLSVPYPKVCATVQADALRGPAPWQPHHGILMTLNTCTSSSLPATVPSSGTKTATNDAVVRTLPFTGMDVNQLAFVGSALLLLGSFLISTGESRRRLLIRTVGVRPADVKRGFRRMGRWWFGL